MNNRSVRVSIVGAGNCASSFVQGLTWYRDARDEELMPGLTHASIGRYRVRDVEIVSAFDVHAGKVGRDLAEALRCEPNNTRVFADVAPTGVSVARGPTLDGIGAYLRDDR